MIAAGIGWASIVAMPYVILVEHLPKEQYGIFMGIFNMFIVLPEIMVSLTFGKFVVPLLHNNHAYLVALGGILLVIAAIITPTLTRFEHVSSEP
jgi:maltose/moltooligosaccharide transporter